MPKVKNWKNGSMANSANLLIFDCYPSNCDILGRQSRTQWLVELGNRRSGAATGKRPLLLSLHHDDNEHPENHSDEDADADDNDGW